jgi:hypothetical protein
MMGVMPVLAAESANIPMTVTVVKIISITASPSTISFGTVTPGTAAPATDDPVVVTNTGNVDVTIEVSVEDTDDISFYEAYLYTSPNDATWTIVTSWVTASHVIPHTTSNTEDIYLQIDLGSDVPEGGTYSATLVVFAAEST